MDVELIFVGGASSEAFDAGVALESLAHDLAASGGQVRRVHFVPARLLRSALSRLECSGRVVLVHGADAEADVRSVLSAIDAGAGAVPARDAGHAAGTGAAFRTGGLAGHCVVPARGGDGLRAISDAVSPLMASGSRDAPGSVSIGCAGISTRDFVRAVGPLAMQAGVALEVRSLPFEVNARLVDYGGTSSGLAPITGTVLRMLDAHFFSSTGESLASVVARLCVQRQVRLAVAESCTGGLLGAAVTAVPGSSAFFLGGTIAYANEEKTRALGVAPELISAHGAVSEPVARAMAEGVREKAGATHALAVTGVAGPGGGSAEKPVGTVWIALATATRSRAVRYSFGAESRDFIRQASVSAALDMLRRDLGSEA